MAWWDICTWICYKFPTESNSERILKIGQYLVKLWARVRCLLFLTHSVHTTVVRLTPAWSLKLSSILNARVSVTDRVMCWWSWSQCQSSTLISRRLTHAQLALRLMTTARPLPYATSMGAASRRLQRQNNLRTLMTMMGESVVSLHHKVQNVSVK